MHSSGDQGQSNNFAIWVSQDALDFPSRQVAVGRNVVQTVVSIALMDSIAKARGQGFALRCLFRASNRRRISSSAHCGA